MTTNPHAFDPAQYDRDGFAHLPAVFTAEEVDDMRSECDRLWAQIDLDAPADNVHWRDHAQLGRIADRLDPVHTHSAFFAGVTRHPVLVAVAETIVGGSVFVLKDKIIMKRPGTAGYGVHQDFAYWDELGLGADQVFTAMIALDDATPAHGPLELYPGLHRLRLPPDPADPLDVDPKSLEGRDPYVAAIQSGDVLAFHALCPHKSRTNTAAGTRRVYQITYAREIASATKLRALYENATRTRHQVHRRDRATAAN